MLNIKVDVLITKIDRVVTVDFSRFNDEMLEGTLHKGIDNILNDANANATKKGNATDDEIWALSMKTLDALYAGTHRFLGRGNPVKDEAIRLAIGHKVRSDFVKAGKALDAKAMKVAALEIIERNPAYMILAQANIDALEKQRKENAERVAAALSAADMAGLELKEPAAA